MATLKELVNETTNIKNDIKTCYTNFKNKLIARDVDISNNDTITSLINKIELVGGKWATGSIGTLKYDTKTYVDTKLQMNLNFEPKTILCIFDSIYIPSRAYMNKSSICNATDLSPFFIGTTSTGTSGYNGYIYFDEISSESFIIKGCVTNINGSVNATNGIWIALDVEI